MASQILELGRPESSVPTGVSAQLSPSAEMASPRVAVLVPCYNEAPTIGKVIAEFREALPTAEIYVYDNNSRDGTAELARDAGATVRYERRQGKGWVVLRMFADIEADVYVLVDGDDTYEADAAPRLVEYLLESQLDLVIGSRVGPHTRLGHRFGNQLFNRILGRIFGKQFDDFLSGYKIMSRRFVKSFPALTAGFEIETEITVHALRLRMPVAELPTTYGTRPEGSVSKLHTIRDGCKVLWSIFQLVKDERPLAFFSTLCGLLAALSVGLGAPLIVAYLQTGIVLRLPTAVLAMGIMLLAFLALVCGFVLDTVTRGRTELKRLHYLALPAPGIGIER